MRGIDAEDRGFTLGHGLFETLLWRDGALASWDAHIDRLTHSCPQIGLPSPDPQACRRAVDVALAHTGPPDRAAVRVTWSAGRGGRGLDMPASPRPVLTVTVTAAHAPEGPVALITAQVRRNDRSPASRLKTLAYLDNVLARGEARAAGAEEALMLNTRGEIACAAAANVFWIRADAVFTPSLTCGVLAGTVRADVLEACRRLGVAAHEVRARPRDLAGAAMFLTNSLMGIRPVAVLDGRDLPEHLLIAALTREIASQSLFGSDGII